MVGKQSCFVSKTACPGISDFWLITFRGALLDPYDRRRGHISHGVVLVLEQRLELENQLAIGESTQGLHHGNAHQRALVVQGILQISARLRIFLLRQQRGRKRTRRGRSVLGDTFHKSETESQWTE